MPGVVFNRPRSLLMQGAHVCFLIIILSSIVAVCAVTCLPPVRGFPSR